MELMDKESVMIPIPPPPARTADGFGSFAKAGSNTGMMRRFVVGSTFVLFVVAGLWSMAFFLNIWPWEKQASKQVTLTLPPVCGTWEISSSRADLLSGESYLLGLTVLSADNVWAVGRYRSFLRSLDGWHPLIEHWDGKEWTRVPAPDLPSQDSGLYDVAGRADNDILAVGYTGKEALVLHWDGKAWRVLATPTRSPKRSVLRGVKVMEDGSAWAVGFSEDEFGKSQTLILRWDGSQWTSVLSRDPGTEQNVLYGLSGLSESDIWAVGYHGSGDGTRILIEHWDGVQWKAIPGPEVQSPSTVNELSSLYSVAAISPSDVWAIGDTRVYTTVSALSLHWNGVKWSIVPGVNASGNQSLTGLAAVSSSDVWAVGTRDYDTTVVGKPLITHWDGTQWKDIVVPSLSDKDGLRKIAVSPENSIWAVGDSKGNAVTASLVRRPCSTPASPGSPVVP